MEVSKQHCKLCDQEVFACPPPCGEIDCAMSSHLASECTVARVTRDQKTEELNAVSLLDLLEWYRHARAADNVYQAPTGKGYTAREIRLNLQARLEGLQQNPPLCGKCGGKAG